MRLVPPLREQELLYSAIARGHRYLQAPGAGPFMRELLGRRFGVASVDLPGNLLELARDVPDCERSAVVDAWMNGATLLRFHTAFVPSATRDAARAAMRGDVAGLHARLGVAAFRIRSPERLRFCPDCLSVMEGEGRDLWWRRDHQLPGIPVCPVHGTTLRMSDVAPGADRHSFFAASPAVCRDDAPLAIEDLDVRSAGLMADLARRSAALLTTPPPALSFEEIRNRYRERLAEVGLMRSPRKVDHAALHTAFRDRWQRLPDLIPGLELTEAGEASWLSALVRNGRRAAHPLQHLMLIATLDELAAVPAKEPFGPGPWPCRNPAADHHGREVVGAIEVRRDRGTLYGDFACSCGYLYTRSISPDGVIGAPRYCRFGPLLAPALEAAVARGDGLRATARALGLDPKTLMREAAIAGVAVPWTMAASGRVPAPRPAERGSEAIRSRRPGRRRRTLRNWFAIDTRLARAVKVTVPAILAERPPVRVTFAEGERRVSRRDWVRKRIAKLPQTATLMEALAETTEAFRRRRLGWCLELAFEKRRLRPCDVLREAGLPMEWLPEVRAAVAAACDARQSASGIAA